MTKITEYLEIILDGGDLSFDQAEDLLDKIFTGEVADVQIAAFLAAMRVKKASVSELAGLAKSLRSHAVRVEVDSVKLVDTCGTGGAKVKTFNISTAAAFVAAGAGVCVAKHGNRGITSKCGSADVLEALGVNINPGVETVKKCIEQAGVGFMFAPGFHPAMKYVQPVRKSLDFRTAFNILGPLANPAGASRQVIGVGDESLMVPIAETLKLLGSEHAMVVHSDGLDEISTMGPTKVIELNEGKLRSEVLEPGDYGISLSDYSDLAGGDAEHNAEIIGRILQGQERGAKRDIVVLNAAAAIIVSDIVDNFTQAIKIANDSIDNGLANNCLERMIEISNS